jgi:cell wall assembly regulator SMI1
MLKNYRVPATEQEINSAENKLERVLPESYKRFLRIHNGQFRHKYDFLRKFNLFPVEDLPLEYNGLLSLKEQVDGDSSSIEDIECDPQVLLVYASDGWVPFAVSLPRSPLCRASVSQNL